MRHNFLTFYTFLVLAYITLTTSFYQAVVIYYYLVLVAGPLIFKALTPYLKAVYTILDLSKFNLKIALKI